MFQPETEDMLPRMAPKPSPDVPDGHSNIRPQVPEVSILFGQQDSNFQQRTLGNPLQQQKGFPQQTYASWKKQMLPKVTYPPATIMSEPQLQGSNVIGSYSCVTTNMHALNANPAVNIDPNGNLFVDRNGEVTNQITYRRSLESVNNKVYQPTHHFPILPPKLPLCATSGEILTICAGTQTDANFESTNSFTHIQSEYLSNLATKQDIENVGKILDELRAEQQRILKLLETVLLRHHSQTAMKAQKDVDVQVNFIENENPYVDCNNAPFQDQQLQPKNKFLQNLKNTNNMQQTPTGKPIAQSTAYRPDSPQFQAQNLPFSPLYQEASRPAAMLPKSASNASLAMNELALKYLPNEKLAELLKELNMSSPTAAVATNEPISNVENYEKLEKGPSDISNASYKYLKKYRLLPEDHEESRKKNGNADEGATQKGIENQTPQYNSPQYNMQNTPTNQRQTPANKCSPYAGRLPLSPLARAPPPPLQSPIAQHIVNLENIKHQPKFL